MKSDEFFGVIGPSDAGEAAFWAPIFQRSNLMAVSVSIVASYHTSKKNSSPLIIRHSKLSVVCKLNFGKGGHNIIIVFMIVNWSRVRDQVYTRARGTLCFRI